MLSLKTNWVVQHAKACTYIQAILTHRPTLYVPEDREGGAVTPQRVEVDGGD